ncbi:MAG: hypothetical protein IJK23_13320 [Clostridia bacterium]|nr:hypothetical protein [Clostridia bacterium]
MKKKRFRLFIKVVAALVSFWAVFFLIQPFFVPKFIQYEAESTVFAHSFFALPENSVDVLFFGSSEMYCAVDSDRLYSKYGVNAWNFGSAGQTMAVTPYYLYEALKTQSPQTVAVEVGGIFYKNSDLDASEIAWNYAPMPLTKEKIASLEQVLGSKTKAHLHAFFPLLVYHDRWRVLNHQGDSDAGFDIDYVFHPEKYDGLYPRGFSAYQNIHQQNYDFAHSDTALKEIPEESRNAVDAIAEACRRQNIRLLFFRSPAVVWTRGESESVRRFMEGRGLEFIDLNDRADELSVSGKTDFCDGKHVSLFGAVKVTDFLAKILSA